MTKIRVLRSNPYELRVLPVRSSAAPKTSATLGILPFFRKSIIAGIGPRGDIPAARRHPGRALNIASSPNVDKVGRVGGIAVAVLLRSLPEWLS